MYIFFSIIIIGCMFYYTSNSISFKLVFDALTARLFLGEFASLPTYFEIFNGKSASVMTLIPPYIQGILGIETKSISRIAIEHLISQDKHGIVGVANTMFVGSSYALMGKIGIILSPFVVFINYYIVTWLFSSLRKDLFSAFIFGYLLFRMSMNINSSIGYFIFSGVQIVLMLFFILKMMDQINNKSLNKSIQKIDSSSFIPKT